MATDTRTVSVTAFAGPLLQLLGSNPTRFSLIISAGIISVPGNIVIFKSGPLGNVVLYTGLPPYTLVLPWRDYGPAINREITVDITGGTCDLSITEIFKV
jgi:hypothetical protein